MQAECIRIVLIGPKTDKVKQNKKTQHRSWHTHAIALKMKYKRLRYSHSLAEAVVSQKQFTTALSSCCAYQSNIDYSLCRHLANRLYHLFFLC